MDEAEGGAALQICDFAVDTVRGCLRGADGLEIALAPKPFDLLVMLARNPGRTLSKDALLDAVWPGVTVTEDSLFQAVREARRAIGDEAAKVLRSVPRRGYLLEVAASTPPAPSAPAPPVTPLDRPALAVLPFANLSGEAGQEYFSDGITEELITQLSRARWFYVIARNSSFTYKGRSVDLRQVGRELGVRYVLEGSVRRAAGRVRITCQLIDAETGHQLWAERFDGAQDDIFELQDRVAAATATAIEPNLHHAELRRAEAKPTESQTAYDLYLRTLPRSFDLTREEILERLGLLRGAIALDPRFTLGKALAALLHVYLDAQGQSREGDREEGVRLAREAFADHRDDPLTLRCAGHALSYLGHDHVAGLQAAERALALNPNSAQVCLSAGWIFNYAGRPAEALRAFEHAIRLSPLDTQMGGLLGGTGMAHLIAGDLALALEWGQRAVAHSPGFHTWHRLFVAANWLLGREEAARAAVVAQLRLAPQARIPAATPFRDVEFVAVYHGALRAAGYPDSRQETAGASAPKQACA